MIIKELGVIQCTCKYETSVVVSIAIVSLVWITKAFNLEWLLNL